MKINKVLIIRFSSMGDVLLALPVAMAIKQNRPQAGVDFLTRAEYAPIFDQFPAVDKAFSFDGKVRSLLGALRQQKYDTVIDLQKNPRSLFITAVLNPKNVISYPKRRLRRELIIRRPNFKFNIGHTVDAYLAALNRAKIKPVTRRPHVELQPEVAEFGREFIRDSGLRSDIIGLCPGSKHYEKRWLRYPELAAAILESTDKSIIVFSGPHDDFTPDLGIKSGRLRAAHGLRLDQVAGIMSCCKLVATNDSGLMHLAVSLSVPVVAIFGPTNPSLGFSPLGPNDIVICDDVPCSPCSLHGEKKCRMPRKICFENITPERVIAEIEKVLYVETSQIL